MRTVLGMLWLVVWTAPALAGDDLDRAAISAGVNRVKAAVTACESTATTGGMVRVKVTVGADGTVTTATTDASDKPLGECVVGVMKTATFGASKHGGSFSYPFVFASGPAAVDDVQAIPPVPNAAGAPPSDPDAQPLDRQSIVTAMALVKAKVRRCGEKAKSGGTVKVKVVVKPSGRPGAVTIAGGTAVDARLKACTIAAVKRATFGRSTGGTFVYPFVFHSHDIQSNAPAKDPLAAPATIALDRTLITAGLAVVKPRIAVCGETVNPGGAVKVKVVVEPDGSVGSAVVERAHDAAIGDCVVAAIKTAKFAITTNGGSFSYPFVFAAKYPASRGGPGAPAGGGGSSTVAAPAPDENLDRASISDGVAKVKGSIKTCATTAPQAKGAVKIKVVVAPGGAVSSAAITATPDPALGDCVRAAMLKATFKATKNGGSFSYPFVF